MPSQKALAALHTAHTIRNRYIANDSIATTMAPCFASRHWTRTTWPALMSSSSSSICLPSTAMPASCRPKTPDPKPDPTAALKSNGTDAAPASAKKETPSSAGKETSSKAAKETSSQPGTPEVQRTKPWWERQGFRQEARWGTHRARDGACLHGCCSASCEMCYVLADSQLYCCVDRYNPEAKHPQLFAPAPPLSSQGSQDGPGCGALPASWLQSLCVPCLAGLRRRIQSRTPPQH